MNEVGYQNWVYPGKAASKLFTKSQIPYLVADRFEAGSKLVT